MKYLVFGDFDTVESINQYLDIKEGFEREGNTVLTVAGNHDHAVLNCFQIYSGTLDEQGLDISKLNKDLINDERAYNFIEELVAPKEGITKRNALGFYLDNDLYGKKYDTILIHGGLEGDMSSCRPCPDSIRNLWIRLRNRHFYMANFDEMKKYGLDMMIRGHDHPQWLAILEGEDEVKLLRPDLGNKFYLYDDKMYTINPGTFYNGEYAMIDTSPEDKNMPLLTFHKLDGKG